MSEKENTVSLKLGEYDKPGLYLIFEDSTRLAITRENVEKITQEYWMDPDKIPQNVKKAVSFQRCLICPLKDNDICDALRPTLPLLSVMDKYKSFSKVTAIFIGDDKNLIHIADTTLQRALRYISCLSLMSYCQIGREYWRYYVGIIPMMKTHEIANRIYLNIYWSHGGNENLVHNIISKFSDEITATTQNQVKRLRLICKHDAFLNAFVLTHLVTDVLDEFRDKKLREQMKLFDLQH